jgi:poly(3-hydroxybutyrate) depolymerase
MTDPFRTAALRGRIIAAGALMVAAALIVAVSYLEFGIPITNGQPVQAEVLRVGTHPAARVAGGDLPILTVRLPNGSVRDVQATWADIDGCKTGRSISLVEQGNALEVGRPGCVSPH